MNDFELSVPDLYPITVDPIALSCCIVRPPAFRNHIFKQFIIKFTYLLTDKV